jgi:hypothetical protein
MQKTKTKEPLVEFVDHHTQFDGPYSPRSAAQSAKSVPELATHTNAVFAMFRPDARLHLISNWMDKFETTDGIWGGHLSLAWRSGGQWLFAGRSGLAVLGKQVGLFDWVQFEHRRRRFEEMRKTFEDLRVPRKSIEEMERLQGKPVKLPVPIPLELWVVVNQSVYPIEVRGYFHRSFGRAQARGTISFMTWEAGRYGMDVVHSNRRVGRISPELEFAPSGGSRVKVTILQLPDRGYSVEALGGIVGVKDTQSLVGRFDSVFDRMMIALVE